MGVFFFLAGSLAEAEPAKKEAPRVEGELLIWSGGKTRAEAERQQQALKGMVTGQDAQDAAQQRDSEDSQQEE
jgi:hypothetical protein